MRARLPLRASLRPAGEPAPVVPPDPRSAIAGPLDPTLLSIRSALVPHRRRLWLRRIVRRTWIALAAIVVAELLLWTVARFVPIEFAPVIGVAMYPGHIVVTVTPLPRNSTRRLSRRALAAAFDAE